ncbi:hypothetical protein RND71_018630 [Anisodus tanguticus]|uniref:C3H1-type domain-containing protein n=1 Tax=Anisodus tanguticus TaxID=243964 RepID=A0AAE1S320_9SOLA|nr:hypothetical protein RND71_018630 [Anisodus tanguticus]
MDGSKRVFNRLGPSQQQHGDNNNKQPKVCYHWRAGRCNRFPCPFFHRELSAQPHQQQPHGNNGMSSSSSEQPHGFSDDNNRGGSGLRRNPNFNNTWGRTAGGGGAVVRKTEKVVTGIAFPSGSDKLYSGSTDKTVRVWDCQSGQAWNTQTGTDLSLNGPVGQVYALVVGNDMLLAGTEDGILAWKYNGSTNNFDPIIALTGHTHHVVSLVVGANRLYSGSMDNSIRVWNLETLQCLQILTDHTNVVMSVLCWDQFLLSCSLDKTIKVWAANESGNLEVTYTHQEERVCETASSVNALGLLALCGMHDAEAKPVLLCSCNDNTIRVYDLPSFSERGKIFSKEGVCRIEIGPAGLFFTGDESGQVRVWKWSTESSSSTS